MLEERKREQRTLGKSNANHIHDIENEYVLIENMPVDVDTCLQSQTTQLAANNQSDTAHNAPPLFSNGDDINGNRPDMQKYLSSRRHTFAVALNPQEVELISVQNSDVINIPEISRRSPTPPPGEQRKLSYKEQFLPCPAVLQVRPSYDRRASDGSASIQSSIAQFHALRKARKAFNQVSTHDDSSSGSNQSSMEQLLGVPSFKDDDRDSGSDQEPDFEAVARYLKGRGRQQRHSLGCTIDPPPTLSEDGIAESFCAMPQRRTALVPTRERERASPIPYSPALGAPVEVRSRYHRRSSEGNTGAVLKASLGQIGEHPDPMKNLQAEFHKLQQLYGNRTEKQHPRPRRNQNQKDPQVRKRDIPARHSYPAYQDMGTPNYEEAMTQDNETDNASDVPGNDPGQVLKPQDELLLMLRMKQEEEMQRLRQEQLLKHKLLLKRQEEEQRELIRRASGGSPNLEASIETFLKMKGLAPEGKVPVSEIGPPVSSAFQQQPEQLQEQMQRLNLRIPEIAFPSVANDRTTQVNSIPFHSPFSSRQSSTPAVPDEPHLRGHIRQKSAPAGMPYTEPTKQMDIDVSRTQEETSRENDAFQSIPHHGFPQAPIYFPFAMHPLFVTDSVGQTPSPLHVGHNGNLVSSPVSPRMPCPTSGSQTMDATHLQRLIPNNNSANLDTNASSYWTNLMLENLEKNDAHQQQTHNSVYLYTENNMKEVSHPLRTAISYDMISEKEIAFIVSQIQGALDARQQSGLDYSKSDSYFSLFGNGVQMEIEVSNVPGSDLNGIKLRKVDGDTWVYKKLCNELLSVIKV